MCNDYPYIKLNTLEKPYLYLKQELPKITIEENLHLAVKKIDKIIKLSELFGLIIGYSVNVFLNKLIFNIYYCYFIYNLFH